MGATNKKMVVSTLVRDGESELQGNMEDITQTHSPVVEGSPTARCPRRAQQKNGALVNFCDSRLESSGDALDSGG